MRHKARIVTHIYAPKKRFSELEHVVRHAGIWSDEIYVTAQGFPPDWATVDAEILVDTVSRTRGEAHRWLYGVYDKWGDEPVTVCVVLEPEWLINDPYIVRDAIELSSEGTLFAHRYMMVNDDEYRRDGIYTPIPVAVAYRVRAAGKFSSELNAAPDYAWTALEHTEAPFDVLDFQLKGTDMSGATIRSYEGMIPILKEHP